MPAAPFFSLAPDWVCEVLSPGTQRLDRMRKLPIYARERVRHAWLVNPDEKTLEVFRLEGALYTLVTTSGDTEKGRFEPFDAIEIDLRGWWTA